MGVGSVPANGGYDAPVNDDTRNPHPHSAAAGAPGASGPGDPAYDGEATIGDEPGHEQVLEADADASASPPEGVQAKLDEVDRLLEENDDRSSTER